MIRGVVKRMSANISQLQTSHISNMQTSQDTSWWSRRTKLERILCFFTVIIFILLIVTVILLSIGGYFYLEYAGSPISPAVCLTPGCVKAASEILLNIDESVDPCIDFYQFACGGWLNRYAIPEDKSQLDSLEKLNDDYFMLLKGLLEKKLDHSEPPYVRKIKDLYDSCMDLNAIEEEGGEPLKEILSTFGGWPVVEGGKWNEDKFDWIETLASFRKFGYSHNILFSLEVDVDERNNKVNIINLRRPSLTPRDSSDWMELGLNDTTTAAYYKKMIRAAEQLGAHHNAAENELLEVLLFEITLANYSSMPDEDEENVSRWDNKYTVKDLQGMIPQVPWLKYFNSLLDNEIYENETLMIHNLMFLKNFAKLVTMAEKRVISNYMMWRVVDESMLFLSKKWRDIELEYNKVKMGDDREKPRYIQCIGFTRPPWNVALGKIDVALSAYYQRHYFDEKVYNMILKIAEYIHEVFLNILDEIKWMDEITKAHAKSKAENMKIFIGYPKELLNDNLVTEFFEDLDITNESYYRNIFKIKKWATDYEFSQLRKPFVRGEWMRYAEMEIDALVDNNDNIIQFPPGIFQYPFFNKDRPHYLNFGGIGSVIGHEVTHGFDDRGRMYDKDGNMADWWEATSDEQFEQRAECFIDQYGNYTTDIGMKVDGWNTEDENIADNGGLKEAYLAYLSWVEDNGPEQLLPGLNYNQKQLFWISDAHNHCGKSRPETVKFKLLNDNHSPYKFRVIGPMSNLEEFSKDFNCPLDSPLNKQPKCQIW